MDYRQTLDFLFVSLPEYQRVGGPAYNAKLDKTVALDGYFGHPHTHFHTIHVAGTNGKGSTSHMLASVLQCAGYRVGLYTSPHLNDFRERIKIDGKMISEDEVTGFVASHREIIEKLKPSFFEMTVAMAYDWFARRRVDVAVVEVGMGGRLDSTNIVTPLVSVITNISFDHTQFLGDTLEKIAGEKAGIIKPGIPVVIGDGAAATRGVFIEKAAQCGSMVFFADERYAALRSRKTAAGQVITLRDLSCGGEFDMETDLGGHYQMKNIPTVLTVLDVLKAGDDIKFSYADVEKGIASAAETTGLYGRWQVLATEPLTVADIAHNKAGLAETAAQIESCSYDKLYMVIGFVNDKDLEAILPLLPKKAYYFFTQTDSERALDAKLLAEQASRHGLYGEISPDVTNALARARKKAAPGDMIYVGGSSFIVARLPLSTPREWE